jgi:hypothetical protein
MSIRFLNPQFLWLFSLISIVIILHLIRPRRITIFVSSLLLWEKILRESTTGKWFKKLPKNILLYLQIFILSLLILSLAQPQLYLKNNINSPLVIIIDASASTSSRDILPSRFEEMKKQALSIIRNLFFLRPVALIEAGNEPKLISSFTLRHDIIEKKIKSLENYNSKNGINHAIDLSESLLPNTSKEIHIFTDGNAPFSLPENSINNYYIHIIGKSGDNVGITDAKILPKNKEIMELFIEISNFSDSLKSFPIEIYDNNKLLDRKNITLNPKEIKRLILNIPNFINRLKVKININDNLLEDNIAYLYIPKLEPKILLITTGNPFLEKALKAIPNVYLDVRQNLFQDDFLAYDFIIFDQLIPQTIPAGNYIFIGYPPQSFNYETIGKLSQVKIISCEDIPIFNTIKPININISSVYLLKSDEFKPILYSQNGPVGFIYEEYNLFSIILPFSILDTDWYYYESFPIFFYNVINYALSYDPQKSPGEKIRFRDKNPEIIIETPKGEKKVKNNLGFIEFSENFTPGFYIAKTKNERIFTVNIFSKEESDIKPKYKIENLKENKTPKQIGVISFSFSPFLLLSALIFLLFEIIIFIRGASFK